jgi:hypothetical protein
MASALLMLTVGVALPAPPRPFRLSRATPTPIG